MNATDETKPGLRQAALSLHALAEPDRSWILDALPADRASALRTLLAELHELGILPDRSWVGALLPASAPPVEAAPAPGAGALGAIARTLEGEPAHVAAALVASPTWPWRAQVLGALPVAFADEVRRRAAAMSGATALQEAVRRAVQARLGGTRLAAPAGLSRAWRVWRASIGARRWP